MKSFVPSLAGKMQSGNASSANLITPYTDVTALGLTGFGMPETREG
jgi:hypothetical protein